MRKIFRQKYLLRLLITLSLALTILNVVPPKIEEYNERVREEQQRLRREAGGSNSGETAISFGLYSLGSNGSAGVFLLSVFFLSLVFTKRITLSFLSVSLFFFLLYFLNPFIESKLRAADIYLSYDVDECFDFLLVLGELIFSFWIGEFICGFARRISERYRLRQQAV